MDAVVFVVCSSLMDALPTSGRCQVADISEPSGRTNEDEDNVLAVLLCGDIHAAIGARPGLSQLELWRRFVQTSLLVHPGANAHPDAAAALEVAACAWNVLNSNFTCGAWSAQVFKGVPTKRCPLISLEPSCFLGACQWCGWAAGWMVNARCE